MILTIAGRELRSLFLSPLAWVLLAVVQLILAYLFLAQLEVYLNLQPRLAALEGAPGATDLIVAPLLADAAVVLLLVVPLVTMRLLSEERRAGTLELLLSAPVSMTEIVLGKYLGALAFLLIMLLLLALMPLSLLAAGGLDLGKLAAGLLGLALLAAAFAAAGLFLSSLTAQPAAAAAGTFGLLLLLWLGDWSARGGGGDELVRYLALLSHYEPLLRGLVRSVDLAYFALFVLTFLVLSIRRLDAERLVR